jgi:hypothetical protein
MAAQQRQRWWKSELDKFVLTTNFERRGWLETDAIAAADILWCDHEGGAALGAVFSAEGLVKLRRGQLVNAYPNHQELTRPDLLASHVMRYQRHHHHNHHATAVGQRQGGGGGSSRSLVPAIMPQTFVLTEERAEFLEALRSGSEHQGTARKQHHQPQANAIWIVKPAAAATAKGDKMQCSYLVIRRLSDVPRPKPQQDSSSSGGRGGGGGGGTEGTSIQHIQQQQQQQQQQRQFTQLRLDSLDGHLAARQRADRPPLLLGGKQLRLRLYVLVASFEPLLVYLSSLGFARFYTERVLAEEVAELQGTLVRVTRVAVRKHHPAACRGGGAAESGGKWGLDDLRLHLEATRGHAETATLFDGLKVGQPSPAFPRSLFVCSNNQQAWFPP